MFPMPITSCYECALFCQQNLAYGTAGALLLSIGVASCNYGETKKGEDNGNDEINYKAEFRKDNQGLIFTGNANKELAEAVGDYLGVEMSSMEVIMHTCLSDRSHRIIND